MVFPTNSKHHLHPTNYSPSLSRSSDTGLHFPTNSKHHLHPRRVYSQKTIKKLLPTANMTYIIVGLSPSSSSDLELPRPDSTLRIVEARWDMISEYFELSTCN